jgi:serine/threonine protein kinase/tetratricopeptide (TPR) repeat protein
MDQIERLSRIESLFHAALELPQQDRVPFLRNANKEDRDLVDEVLALIAAHEKGNELLDSPTVAGEGRLFSEKSTQAAALFSQGARLNDYRIVSFLDRGGMGEVYLADDTRLLRKVALKILPPGLSWNPERLRRFKREAYAISGLNHPNIITIYEIGESEGLHFIATEYIEGRTVRQICREERLRPGKTIEIIAQVAAALGAAHAQGVVHRDIKPENIMVRPDGFVKVLDFGLAKLELHERQEAFELLSQSSRGSMDGLIVGTPTYMSPEQACGKPVDARSDLFSLGVVAYELLSGKAPFTGENAGEILAAVAKAKPEPIQQVVTGLPPGLDQIVSRMLSRDPGSRYQNAAELIEDLNILRNRKDDGRAGLSLPATSVAGVPDNVTLPSAGFSIPVLPDASGLESRLSLILRRSTNSMLRSVREHRIFSIGVGLVILTALGLLLWPRQIDSLAILPLVNETGDSNLGYLTDGLTENLINSLNQVSGGDLSVISSTSSSKFKPDVDDPASFASKLSVDALVVGRVTRDDAGNLVLSIELINPFNKRQIWGNRYERSGGKGNFSFLPGQIAVAICEELGISGAKDKVYQGSSRPTATVEAYELYLHARNLLNTKRNDENSLLLSVDYLRRSIQKDSTYAPAYAGLSMVYSRLGVIALQPSEMFAQARENAITARDLDPTLADAHVALAYIAYRHDWNWGEAEKELKLALEYNPNFVDAHLQYCYLLSTLDRLPEALSHGQRAVSIDPYSILANSTLATILYFSGSLDQGDALFQKLLVSHPRDFGVYRALAYGQERRGNLEKALEYLNTALQLAPDNTTAVSDQGRLFAKQGRQADALAIIGKLRTMAQQKYVSPTLFAEIYADLGDFDSAMIELDKAVKIQCAYIPLIADRFSLKRLRSDPRFVAFLNRLKIPVQL